MEEKKEMLELLQKIESSTRKQARSSRLQCILVLVAAVCCVAVCLMLLGVLPRVNGVIGQMETVLSNLEQTTQQLAEADLQGMVTDMDALVATGQQSLEQTMEKLNAVDFEALNRAIQDLAEVIEPLAKLVKAFK